MSGRIQERPKPRALRVATRESASERETEHDNQAELSVQEILEWADAHFARTGEWPNCRSGPIPESKQETWMRVEVALRFGLRGVPRGATLAQFLMEHRGRYNRKGNYRITEDNILEWADAWRERTGKWPRSVPLFIPDTPGFTWRVIDRALRLGGKGLPGGSSLRRLLGARRGVRNASKPPKLTVEQVLRWADAYFRQEGEWPRGASGAIADAPGETWNAIDRALRKGRRGLPGNTTLSRLLAQHRGAFHVKESPTLSVALILGWADAWHERVGEWPGIRSSHERVPGPSGIRWGFVNDALRMGRCGLPGGSSLSKLLLAERGVRRFARKSALSAEQILMWADDHFWRTGTWPTRDSGPIFGRPQNTWSDIETRLKNGGRGLPGGSSLARLLADHRGRRNRGNLAPLDVQDILAWADAFHARNGDWPNIQSGPIAEAPGETWSAVHAALSNGCRGFAGNSSLARLLTERRGVYNPRAKCKLSKDQIIAWADAWHARTNSWPTRESGAIPDAGGITWYAVEQALKHGTCGLRRGLTIRRLVASEREVRRPPRVPPLTEEQILAWADEHYRRFRKWPKVLSGSIFGAASEAWHRIDTSLRLGLRGLPGGSSLACLLEDKRGVRNPKTVPRLRAAEILAWADAWHERTGTWPNADSGPIAESPGDTWRAVDSALSSGRRGLPGRSSLFRLLARRRGAGKKTQ
jgi:hypothetical protein